MNITNIAARFHKLYINVVLADFILFMFSHSLPAVLSNKGRIFFLNPSTLKGVYIPDETIFEDLIIVSQNIYEFFDELLSKTFRVPFPILVPTN